MMVIVDKQMTQRETERKREIETIAYFLKNSIVSALHFCE